MPGVGRDGVAVSGHKVIQEGEHCQVVGKCMDSANESNRI
jgi:hypothetical protein